MGTLTAIWIAHERRGFSSRRGRGLYILLLWAKSVIFDKFLFFRGTLRLRLQGEDFEFSSSKMRGMVRSFVSPVYISWYLDTYHSVGVTQSPVPSVVTTENSLRR